MLSYKEFKKGYLNEWVDRSQAARKAAEELAKKEVKPSLRDTYVLPTADNSDLVFTLDGHKVEFKAENEENSNTPYNIFTYDEAIERFGEPDLKDGWRLPTKEELEALIDDYPCEFKDEFCIFDKRLFMSASDDVGLGSYGYYWSATPDGPECAWDLLLRSDNVWLSNNFRHVKHLVRLVRDVK